MTDEFISCCVRFINPCHNKLLTTDERAQICRMLLDVKFTAFDYGLDQYGFGFVLQLQDFDEILFCLRVIEKL